MQAYVLMRDGYLEGVFVANEALKPAKLRGLKAKAEVAGMTVYETSTSLISEMETYIRDEAAEVESES